MSPVIVQNGLPPKRSSTPEATAGEALGLLGRLDSVAAVVIQLVALMVVSGFPIAVIIPNRPLGLCRWYRGVGAMLIYYVMRLWVFCASVWWW